VACYYRCRCCCSRRNRRWRYRQEKAQQISLCINYQTIGKGKELCGLLLSLPLLQSWESAPALLLRRNVANNMKYQGERRNYYAEAVS